MTWTVRPGSTVDGELKVVDEDGQLTPVDEVSWEFFDRTGASISTGSGEYESDGIYLIRPVMPAGAVKGHTYAVTITVTPVSGASLKEHISVPILVGGPTL